MNLRNKFWTHLLRRVFVITQQSSQKKGLSASKVHQKGIHVDEQNGVDENSRNVSNDSTKQIWQHGQPPVKIKYHKMGYPLVSANAAGKYPMLTYFPVVSPIYGGNVNCHVWVEGDSTWFYISKITCQMLLPNHVQQSAPPGTIDPPSHDYGSEPQKSYWCLVGNGGMGSLLLVIMDHSWFTTTNLSHRFPIFETSATALCGTTAIMYEWHWVHIKSTWDNAWMIWDDIRLMTIRNMDKMASVPLNDLEWVWKTIPWMTSTSDPGILVSSLHHVALLINNPLWQEKTRKPSGRVTPSNLWSKNLPKVNVCRPAGRSTASKFCRKPSPRIKVCRPAGRVPQFKLWLKRSPKAKVCKPAGKVTPSKLWLKRAPWNKWNRLPARSFIWFMLRLSWLPIIKLFRPAGRVTPFKLWLKWSPNVKLCRSAGNVTPSKLWLNWSPKVKYWRPAGKVTPCKLWLNVQPRVKFWRPAGKETSSSLWSNSSPKVKVCRLAGSVTPFKLWSKSLEKVKVRRPAGRVTLFKLWLNRSPKVKVCSSAGKATEFFSLKSSSQTCWQRSAQAFVAQGQVLKTCRHINAIKNFVEETAKSQGLQTCRQIDAFQALTEVISENQSLQTCRQSHSIQACVANGQALQTCRQSNALQALVDTETVKRQSLQTCWQIHACQALGEVISKSQSLQTCRQSHSIQASVECEAKRQGLQTCR